MHVFTSCDTYFCSKSLHQLFFTDFFGLTLLSAKELFVTKTKHITYLKSMSLSVVYLHIDPDVMKCVLHKEKYCFLS